MATVTYLFLAILAVASAAPGSRVVGGDHTTIEEFPYAIAFTYLYPGPGITIQRCVGGLISSWHSLCSSFCFTGAILDNMSVRAGSTNSLSGGIVTGIADVIKHPNYIEAPRAADLAVVRFETPFGISSVVNVLFLPPQNMYIEDGQSVKIVSWGFETETGPQLETLKTVFLDKLNLLECQTAFADTDVVEISDEVICAAAPGRGMCTGDSGAPMVIENVHVGLSSYFEDCLSDDYPDVFTRTDRYTNWILEVATAPPGAVRKAGIIDAPIVAK